MDANTRSGRMLGALGAVGVAGVVLVTAMGSPASAARPLARATIVDQSGAVVGEVVFKGEGRFADRVEVELDLPAGAPGLGAYHGLHVHTTGTCTAPFTSAGGHWNPSGAAHGHHAGDLPSVLVSPDGEVYAEFETHRFDVAELFDADGSAVVLHVGPDNFANIPATYGSANATTLATGDAGGRYGCGVVTAAA